MEQNTLQKIAKFFCCFNCMGFAMFLARTSNREEVRGSAANMCAYAEGGGEEAVDMEVKMEKVMGKMMEVMGKMMEVTVEGAGGYDGVHASLR